MFKSRSDPVDSAGTHIIIDMFGLDLDSLINQKTIEDGMYHAAIQAGATILHTYLHPFHNGGVSGVLVLAESHISVHTWPERDYAAFDIFMCGKADPKVALQVLRKWFCPKRCVTAKIKRGVN